MYDVVASHPLPARLAPSPPSTNASVDQAFVTLPFPGGDHWISGLAALIEDIQARDARGHKVIVFFPTTNMCIFFSHVFNKVYRIPNLEIHSKKSQSARTRTSARFRQGRRGVLFTTDVSARGVSAACAPRGGRADRRPVA